MVLLAGWLSKTNTRRLVFMEHPSSAGGNVSVPEARMIVDPYSHGKKSPLKAIEKRLT